MAGGLALAGLVPSYASLMAGYGLFSAASGVTYFLCITAASIELPIRRSVAVGCATSAFAVGGVLWPVATAPLLQAVGVHATLAAVGCALLLAGLAAAALLRRSGAAAQRDGRVGEGLFRNFLTGRPRILIALWSSFVLLGIGGLMAVSHAAGIAVDNGVPESETWLGALLFNLGYIPGALLGGYLSERWTGPRVLVGMGLVVGLPLLMLAQLPSPVLSLAALACVGAAFGASTSTYPVTIGGYYGLGRVAVIYGRVSIAYGVAGLAAPYIAGRLHDVAGDYRLALLGGGIVALASLIPAILLPRSGASVPSA
jgi:predicted MFS family arabinose efflux permease